MFNARSSFENYLKMENSFRLFDDKSGDLIHWDIIRFYSYYYVYDCLCGKESGFLPSNVTGRGQFSIRMRRLLWGIASLFRIRRADWLIFQCSRNRDSHGRAIDIVSQRFCLDLPGNILRLESYGVATKALSAGVVRKIAFVWVRSRRQKYLSSWKNILDSGKGAIKKTFSIDCSDYVRRMEKIILEFEADRIFYKALFAIVKPNAAFITQNGIQKALIYEARRAGIPVAEFQHGIINDSHPAYNYPECAPEMLTLPDVIVMLSDYWKTAVRAPGVNLVTIGNDYFVPAENTNRESKKEPHLVFISSVVHQGDIDRYLSEKLTMYSDYRVTIKLHPNQMAEKHLIRERYSVFKNVSVIFDELSTAELLRSATAVVLIQSTVAYEALQRGVPVYILKMGNYDGLFAIFQLPGVCLVEEGEDDPFCRVRDVFPESIFFENYQKDVADRLIKSNLKFKTHSSA